MRFPTKDELEKEKPKCPRCNKRRAKIRRINMAWGVFNCQKCEDEISALPRLRPWRPQEPDSIKEDRRKTFKDTIQPFRDGTLSREYVETYGTKHIDVNDRDVKKSEYVWRDLPGWSDHF